MKITRILAISLVAVLALGCRYDSPEEESSSDPEVEAPADGEEANKYASLTDTSTETTGKLTYTLDTASNVGTVSVNVLYPVGEEETAYVSLLDAAASTSSMIASIKLDSGTTNVDGEVGIKVATTSSSSADETVEDVTITQGEWVSIQISWSNGSYTLTVNDVIAGTWSNVFDNDVKYIQMKLGNNSNTTTYAFLIDDLIIYNNSNATRASGVTFEDDFESYDLNVDLSTITGYTSYTTQAVSSGTVADDSTDEDTCDSDKIGIAPDNCITAIEDASFPNILDEFNFTTLSDDTDTALTNSGLYNIPLVFSGESNITVTAVASADGTDNSALNLVQDANSTSAYGYMKYTNVSGAATEITSSFSVETVINISDRTPGSSDIALVDWFDSTSNSGFKLYLETSENDTANLYKVKFKVYGFDVATGLVEEDAEAKAAPIAIQEWNHIVAVYDASSSTYGDLIIYINGVSAATKTLDFYPTANNKSATDDFIVLGGSTGSDKDFDGSVDNIATWNDALTADMALTRAAQFNVLN